MMAQLALTALENRKTLLIPLLDGNLGLAPRTFKIKGVTVISVTKLISNVCPRDPLEVVFLYKIV
jgi:hypothetical protein